jgi:site-specific DNA-methyltransferase (adenine-specific)
MSTDPGDIVLDPFLGTGTTAVAAKKLGRHFVGIDVDPEYAKIANEKIENVAVTMYKGYYVSSFLGKIQSIRDIDAAKIFPLQLTSIEKERMRKIVAGVNTAKKRAPSLFQPDFGKNLIAMAEAVRPAAADSVVLGQTNAEKRI